MEASAGGTGTGGGGSGGSGKRWNKGRSARTPFDYAKGLARTSEPPLCVPSRYAEQRLARAPRLGGELALPPACLALLGGHFGVEVVDAARDGRRPLRRRVAFEDTTLDALAAGADAPWWQPRRSGTARRARAGDHDEADAACPVGTPLATIWVTPDGKRVDPGTVRAPTPAQKQQQQKQQGKQQQQQKQKQQKQQGKRAAPAADTAPAAVSAPAVVVVSAPDAAAEHRDEGDDKDSKDSKGSSSEGVECSDNAVVLEVEVRPGECRRITVSLDDNAEDVVRAFGKTHALPEAATDELLRRVFESLHNV